MSSTDSSRPPVVSEAEWRKALDEQVAREKAHMRAGDEVAAARRRLPMMAVKPDYAFAGELGQETLLELFEGRRQLIVYHFMFGPDWEEGCPGCSWVADAMSHPAHLHARDITFAMVSRAPLPKLLAYRKRMGWRLPWYSSFETEFNVDMGVTVDGEEHHGLSVFFRDGDEVFRTYTTGRRGVEHLGSHWTYLDLTPFGRQETWEDSPDGWPQTKPYSWMHRHDAYPD